MARERFATWMLVAFAAFALVLAVVGVDGVLSHPVTQGTHDIGMALGAERSRIQLMVLRQGLELTGVGVALGLIGAAAMTRVMASLLFGISTIDPATFVAVPLILLATAMLACYVPALRATRVDPVTALRDEEPLVPQKHPQRSASTHLRGWRGYGGQALSVSRSTLSEAPAPSA